MLQHVVETQMHTRSKLSSLHFYVLYTVYILLSRLVSFVFCTVKFCFQNQCSFLFWFHKLWLYIGATLFCLV